MNFLVHPAIALTSAGAFDLAEAAGAPIGFYSTANGPSASALSEALDRERQPVVDAFGFPFRSLAELINAMYGGSGTSVREAIEAAPFYKALPPLPPTVWKSWLRNDVPFAHVPYVHVSEAVGCAAPLHRGLIEIFGAILGFDPWAEGLDLAALRLDGLSREEMTRYVFSGRRD